MKRLPVELPHESDRARGTLGYATVAQAPNGTLHVLARSSTHPCLHYEFNEAWVFSEGGDITAETKGGRTETFTERYPGGAVGRNGQHALFQRPLSARRLGNLVLRERQKEHEANYVSGRKAGGETYWAPDGGKSGGWNRDLKRAPPYGRITGRTERSGLNQTGT